MYVYCTRSCLDYRSQNVCKVVELSTMSCRLLIPCLLVGDVSVVVAHDMKHSAWWHVHVNNDVSIYQYLLSV